MSLADHAILWHIYPLGAVGAPIREDRRSSDQRSNDQRSSDQRSGHRPDEVTHRLGRLEAWLDHIVELGCDGLLLGPIFDSATHGYDTLDHLRVDPRLGDDADLDSLVAAARQRGLALVLDGVFNHVGVGHPLVGQALAGEHAMVHVEDVADGPDSEGPGSDRSGSAGWVAEGPGSAGGARRHRGWEGHGDLAELNHDDPAVADLVTDVMLHWLRRGIAGWRLDVAYAVPTQFWAEVIGRVRAEFPGAFFLGEVIHGDYAGFAREGNLDSVTQYELWKAIWSSLTDVNMWELAHALERHADLLEAGRQSGFLPNTFVGNHDVDRIASAVGDQGAALAAILLLTLPGLPSIYYGDESAVRGAKGEGFAADDAVRPELPATPAEMSTLGAWLTDLHRELIALRRRHPWIQRGSVRVVDKQNEWIEYEVRSAGEGTAGEGAAGEGTGDAGGKDVGGEGTGDAGGDNTAASAPTLHVRVEAAPPRAHVRVDGADLFRWEA